METFKWVDTFTLSRPKRSIARDFADGVLVAEIIAQVKPFGRCVELHNFTQASNFSRKMANWATLEHKVLKKLGNMPLEREEMEALSVGVPGAIESFLGRLRRALTGENEAINVDVDEHERHAHARAPAGEIDEAVRKASMAESVPGTRYPELLARRDARIDELEETNEILITKIAKLEQLVRLKDAKIQALEYQLDRADAA